MADIRVDRYDQNISGTSGTITIADVGDITSAFVRITGSSRQDSAGLIGTTSNLGPDHLGVRLELTGTTQITYTKQGTGNVKIMFEVWVYTGSPGGAYEFISRQRGTVSVSGSSNAAAIFGITNRNDCVPFFNGFTTSETSNSDWEQATMACHLNTSSQAVFSRNNSGTTIVCQYDVVEFTGSAWSVGCARSANHDTGNAHFTGGEVVTMNTDSDGQSGSTFDVTDWGTAMIIQGTMEGDSSETGLSDTLMSFLPGPTTTELRCTLDNSNSRNDGVAYAYIIQCNDLVVNRDNSGNITEGSNSYGTPLSAPAGYNYATPLSEMALEWFPGTNGEGTAHARGALNAIIADTGSAYEVRHWIHRSGNNVTATWGFVDLSALVDAGGIFEDASAALNTSASFAAMGVRERIVSATGTTSTSLISSVSRIRHESSSQLGSSATSTQSGRVRIVDSTQTGQSSEVISGFRYRGVEAQLPAQATFIIEGVLTKSGAVLASTQATMTVDASRTASIVFAQTGDATLTGGALKYAGIASSTVSEATLSAIASRYKDVSYLQSSQSLFVTDAVRIRDVVSDLSTVATMVVIGTTAMNVDIVATLSGSSAIVADVSTLKAIGAQTPGSSAASISGNLYRAIKAIVISQSDISAIAEIVEVVGDIPIIIVSSALLPPKEGIVNTPLLISSSFGNLKQSGSSNNIVVVSGNNLPIESALSQSDIDSPFDNEAIDSKIDTEIK